MHLLKLPPELLLKILQYVGANFFREDVRRLAVCRYWHGLALEILLTHVELNSIGLQCMFRPEATSTSATDSHLEPFKHHLKTLVLEFLLVEQWRSIAILEGSKATTLGQYHQRLVNWSDRFDSDLSKLARCLQGSRSLRELRFRALLISKTGSHLYEDTLSHILSLDTLTVLELETCGTSVVRRKNSPKVHLCSQIAVILPSLYRLRLRLHEICCEVLRAPKQPIHLKDVVINLDTYKSHSEPITRSRECGNDRGIDSLNADLQKQATLLVAQMSQPKIVRVFCYSMNRHKHRYFDALTGKQMVVTQVDFGSQGIPAPE
ncbi:hypothetical protein FQN57_004827 [Myotisia sp. PD_48]|nr:hypothetical protein FQN57_004827 [Myotisia sp. PD_48]